MRKRGFLRFWKFFYSNGDDIALKSIFSSTEKTVWTDDLDTVSHKEFFYGFMVA